MNMKVTVHVKYDEIEKTMDIDLTGEEMGVLIGKRGQTLDSLQYLVSLVVNKEVDDYIRRKIIVKDEKKRLRIWRKTLLIRLKEQSALSLLNL